jgi:GTP-binding protein
MKIRESVFEISAASHRQFPEPDLPEVFFLGRSNVGKSSLINSLTGRHSLAKVSVTPGKTRLINFFRIDERFRLVDLPGYGYAKAGHAERKAWARLIDSYARAERPVALAVLLIDFRHHLQDLDAQTLAWLIALELPVQVVLTKADKLSRSEQTRQLRDLGEPIEALGYTGALLPYSTHKGTGKEELLSIIREATEGYAAG